MADHLDKLEKAIGGSFERKNARIVPGSNPATGHEVVYFSDDGSRTPREQFYRLTRQVNPPHLKTGGANERGCKITIPDGTAFYAMSYHGDIDGWRKQVAQGARELGILTATVDGQLFLISDLREFDISCCFVEFV